MSITASCTASRTTGVAPLAVFFDCSGTTSSGTSNPVHDLEYVYDFGDDDAVNWQSTDGSGAWGNSWGESWGNSWGLTFGPSKNVARGPVAVHVYENPGTYTQEVIVTDGIISRAVTNTITVDDPAVVFAGVSTICISASSVPVAGAGGAPAGCSTVQVSSWPVIVNTHAATGRRVLLNRGEIYTGTATAVLDKTGPGIIGMYGTGAKPVIQTTVTTNNANLLRPSTAGVSTNDWRVMDLDFDGEEDLHRNCFTATGNYYLSQFLLLRVDAYDLGGGITVSVGAATPVVPSGLFVVDCSINRINASAGTGSAEAVFISGRQVAVLGSEMDDTTGGVAEHLLRVQSADAGVFSHNVLKNSATGKEMFAIRAPAPSTGPFEADFATRNVVASHNQIETNTYMGIQIDTEANPTLGEIHDVILDGNFYLRTATGGAGSVRIRADRVTARNEIHNMTASAVAVLPYDIRGTGALGSASDNVWIYNNSIYGGVTNSAVIATINGDDVTGLVVRNNLIDRSGGSAPTEVNDTGSNNSYVNGTNLLTDPAFVVDPPVIAADFALDTGSAAIGTGTVVPVFYDFFDTFRSRSVFDIGADAVNTGILPPVTTDEVALRPSGGIPASAYARPRTKEQLRRSRVLHDLEADVVFEVAQRQAEALDLDDLQRKEELLAEMRLRGIETRALHFEELARQREALIDAEIARRIQAIYNADLEAAAMLIMIAAAL